MTAYIEISIHTLHTEGDVEGQQVCRDQVRFQSTPSTRRVTQEQINQRLQIFQFQSTPSTRRVTIPLKDFVVIYRISIHTLHTEGDGKFVEKMPRKTISIHTLHTEGDSKIRSQGTATKISIHTLHTEGDLSAAPITTIRTDFNPHPPHGG